MSDSAKEISHGKLPEKQAEHVPWETLCVDLIGPYKFIQKNKKPIKLWAVTMIDPATGWFEIKEINARPNGFSMTFTKPVDRKIASRPKSYSLTTYTHIYQQGYGSPEVDHTTPQVTAAVVSSDGLRVDLRVNGLTQGHVHDFDLQHVRSAESRPLVHANAYYTLNEIPNK